LAANTKGTKNPRKKVQKGANLDETNRDNLDDFDQVPRRDKDLYGEGAAGKYGVKELSYKPGSADYINFISAFDDSSRFMVAVNKEINILETLSGKVLDILKHPKQVTQCFSFNDDKGIIS
jgi:hypothetical protein